MAANRELNIILTLQDKATAGLKSINSAIQDNAANFKKAGLAVTAFGGAITGALGFAVKAAADAQVQIAKVDATLKSMGQAGTDARDQLLATAGAAVKLGFDGEDAAVSLAQLFQRTGDLTQATKLQAIAFDLARAKNIDLTSATNAVGMVMSGNTKILKQYGIEIKEGAKPLELLGELQSKVAGQAEAFTETMAGQGAVLKETFGDVTEQIGTALLPVITQLAEAIIPVLEKISQWITDNPQLTATIVTIVAAIGGLALVLGPIIAAIPLISAALTVLGAVLAFIFSPIGLVIAAIALLTAGIIWLVKNWDLVKAKIIEVWTSIVAFISPIIQTIVDTVVGAFTAIGNVIQTIMDLIMNIIMFTIQFILGLWVMFMDTFFPGWQEAWLQAFVFFQQIWTSISTFLGNILNAIKTIWITVWTAIKAFFTTIWESMKTFLGTTWDSILGMFNVANDKIKSVWTNTWDSVKNIVVGAWENIKNTIKASINWVLEKINFIIRKANEIASKFAIPGFKPIQIPTIPLLAKGGIVTEPTLAGIGEAGPEAVIPLSRAGGMSGLGTTVNITINGDVSGEELVQTVQDRIMDLMRVNERLSFS